MNSDDPDVVGDQKRPHAAGETLRLREGEVHTAAEDAAAIHPETINDCRVAFATAGVVGFAEAALGVPEGVNLLGLVLDRHRDVH